MANVPTQIRIDKDVKQDVTALFNTLGLDMSSAVNIFLRQCLMRGGLPFPVEKPKYSQETIEAIEEARRISVDPSVKSYTNMDELKKALLDD